MNCESFKNQIVLYASGELTEDAARELLSHAGSCTECAGELKAFKTVMAVIPPAQKPEQDFAILYGKALLIHNTRILRKSSVFKIAAFSSAAAVLIACITIIFALTRDSGLRTPDSRLLTPDSRLAWLDESDATMESLKNGLDELSATFQPATAEEDQPDDNFTTISDNIELAKYNFENPESSFSDSYYDYSVQEIKTSMDSLYYDLTEF